MKPTHILAYKWAASGTWMVRLCHSLKEAQEHVDMITSGMYKPIGEIVIGEIIDDKQAT